MGTVSSCFNLSSSFLCSILYFFWSDDDTGDQQQRANNNSTLTGVSANPFLDTPESASAIEYKKGYVMRKCCYDTSFKKSKFQKYSSIWNQIIVI